MFYSLLPSSYPKMENEEKTHESEKIIFRNGDAHFVSLGMQDYFFIQ